MRIESTGEQAAATVNRRSVLTGAASLGAVAALAAFWRQSQRLANAQGDMRIDLLNLGLQSEYLMCSAYVEAVEYADGMLDARDLEFVEAMRDECMATVERFRGAITELGGQPIAETGMTYPEDAENDREKCLQLLLMLENTTVQGWQGAVPMVADPSIVTLAQPLGFAKARRAAALAVMLGDTATPFSSAIEPGMPLPEVLEKLEPYRGAPE